MISSPLFLFLALAGHVTVRATSAAPVTGLLVVAHGADSAWDARVQETVRQVRWAGPVQVAFLMGPHAKEASFAAGMAALARAGATRAVVVPLMVSSAGGHVREIIDLANGEATEGSHTEHLGTMTIRLPAIVTSALDSAPELGEVLLTRWRETPDRWRRAPVVFVAHGPNDQEDLSAWVTGIRTATRPLASRLGDRAVHVGLLRDDAPAPVRAAAVNAIRDTITALAARSGDSVTVITVLVSSGAINRLVVPRDLEGMPMRYLGASLTPHPAVARWIERVAGEVHWLR